MADYFVVATYEYDNFNGFWQTSPQGLELIDPPFLTVDNDDSFGVGDDISGNGNEYLGYIVIDGVDFPVITGPQGDTSTPTVIVPQGIDPNTVNFPDPVDTNNTLTSPFFTDPFDYCFAEGTLIATTVGDVPVEALTREHMVLTADGRAVPVFWLGRQRMAPRFAASGSQIVEIAAGALGDGLPVRDLRVTGDHALLVDDVLVNAAVLVNGGSVRFVPRADLDEVVMVYHVETEAHEVLLAEGVACESFIDYAGRARQDNYAEYLEAYGADRMIPEMDLPRISSARLLPEALSARLATKGREATSSAA